MTDYEKRCQKTVSNVGCILVATRIFGKMWWAIVCFCTNLPMFYSCYLLLPDKTNTQYLLNLDSKMKKNLSNSLLFVPTTHWCMQSRRGCTPIIQGQNWNSYNNRPLLYSLVIVNWTKSHMNFNFFTCDCWQGICSIRFSHLIYTRELRKPFSEIFGGRDF